MREIKSINNPQVKSWRKLQKKKERKKAGTYLIEGFHLVEEAIQYEKESIHQLIVREDLVDDLRVKEFMTHFNEEKITIITKEIAKGIASTETNQGIFANLSISLNKQAKEIKGPFLLLDAVQDPGNVGTMIRTADAAGFQAVVLGKGSVDLYNDKLLRSAQGSHFHLDIYEADLVDFIPFFKKTGYPVLGTALNTEAKSYKEIEMNSPFALIVGNEGAGMSEEVTEWIDQNIYIPMKGQTESLNVAIAASILMFYLN